MWSTTGERKEGSDGNQVSAVWAFQLLQRSWNAHFSFQKPAFLIQNNDIYTDWRNVAMKKVAVIMGSVSDLPVVEKAIHTLQQFGVPFEVHVYSAHRTPDEARAFALHARENGFGVILAAAGMAAHLAGSLAALTTLPVIGIPMKSSTFTNGIDALLSTVQMPSGIPVATVAVDGAVNAALLSVEILAVSDEALAVKLAERRAADTAKVLDANTTVETQYNC